MAVDDLRVTLARLSERASIRELAHLCGVTHDVIFRVLHGSGVHKKTLRRLQEGLAGSHEAEAFDRLDSALRDLCRGSVGVRQMQREWADAAEQVLQNSGRSVPSWVRWLREGKRTWVPVNVSVRAWADAVSAAQARSKGGIRKVRAERRGLAARRV